MLQRRETNIHLLRRLGRTVGAGVVRLLLLIFIGLSMLSGTFWYRSAHTWDIVEVASPEQTRVISSAIDRLVIRSLVNPDRNTFRQSPMGWNFRSIPGSAAVDPWEPGGWKLIGVDWDDVEPTRDQPYVGTWVRIKWSTLLFVFAVPPMGWAIWQRMRDRRQAFVLAGYCPKCEFPQHACTCSEV